MRAWNFKQGKTIFKESDVIKGNTFFKDQS